MNQQEIIEFNRKCAEFMDIKLKPRYRHLVYGEFLEDMKFHSDWNWIMQVVENIEGLGFEVVLDTSHTFVRYSGTNTQTGLDKSISKKERIINSINEFLTWYNSANK